MLKLDALTLLLSASLVLFPQLFTLLTIPYFAAIHESEFDTSLWGNWFRLFSYLVSLIFSLTGIAAHLFPRRFLLYTTLSGLSLSLTMTVYNVLFGLRVPAVMLCAGDTSDVCMENPTACGAPSRVKTWEAFFFSFSLCVLICVQTAAIGVFYRKLGEWRINIIQPVALHPQVVTDVSARGLEVSTIIVESQKAPLKSGREEKALIESHFIRKPEEPVQAKVVRFGVEEKTADVLSFKDFENSSVRTDLSIGKRGGRGRGKK
jgi:hypothetical protein